MTKTIYHVSLQGDDQNSGSAERPLVTIQAAADKAQAGDIVEVHSGTYREWIKPPRGGASDDERIVYRAAKDESVIVKGSEIITGWKVRKDCLWVAEVSNEIFGDFNPFAEQIEGDWFNDMGRPHHRGSIYLNGEWLIEAAKEIEVGKLHFFAQVDGVVTRFIAHFGEANPNEELTEFTVRPAIFYPENTGINYLTVSGFTLTHAATNWAPPTS